MKSVLVTWKWMVVALAAAGLQTALGAAFEKNAKVVFLGDSITHQARWTSFVTRYYLEWLPEQNVTFYNAGVGGDTMSGCLGRLAEDVNPHKPDVIVTMFGMNDVGGALWAETFGEKENARKKEILDRYEGNLKKLAARLKADNPKARLMWCTPSIYDETAVMDKPSQPGRNRELLAGCAEIVKRFAATTGDEVIDFNGPMTTFNAQKQKKDPKFTLVGPDRVHPLQPGAFFMACEFLRQQGLDPRAKNPLKPWRETDVSRACEKARWTEDVLRGLYAERWYLRNHKINPDDLVAVAAFADKLKADGKKGYFEERIPDYLKGWPTHEETTRKFLQEQAEALAVSRRPRLAVFGGSFSVIKPSQAAKDGWRKELGRVVDDYGIGGCGFKAGEQKGNDVYQQVSRALASGHDYEAFILWASTNDLRYKDVNVQNAGVERVVALIREKAPKAKILFFTSMPVPLRAKMHAELADYVAGQIKTCEKLGIPYLDHYSQSGVTLENSQGLFGKDNFHPSEAGYAKVRDMQVAFLKKQLEK